MNGHKAEKHSQLQCVLHRHSHHLVQWQETPQSQPVSAKVYERKFQLLEISTDQISMTNTNHDSMHLSTTSQKNYIVLLNSFRVHKTTKLRKQHGSKKKHPANHT